MDHFLLTPFGSHFKSFEKFGFLGPGASSGNAGIGLWIVLLIGASAALAVFYRGLKRPLGNGGLAALRWVPFLSLAVFMAKVATFENDRQMAAYYALLFPAILVASGHAYIVRRKWWQWAGLGGMLLTAAMLVVARDRPLFPAKTILLPLTERHPQWKFLSRAWESYACRLSVETQRNAFRNTIPAKEKVIGYATVRGSQEPGQWLPFGHRRVERVLPNDTPMQLQDKHIHFVLVDSGGLSYLGMTIGQWTNQFDGVLIDTLEMETSPGETGSEYLVRLNNPIKRPW